MKLVHELEKESAEKPQEPGNFTLQHAETPVQEILQVYIDRKKRKRAVF